MLKYFYVAQNIYIHPSIHPSTHCCYRINNRFQIAGCGPLFYPIPILPSTHTHPPNQPSNAANYPLLSAHFGGRPVSTSNSYFHATVLVPLERSLSPIGQSPPPPPAASTHSTSHLTFSRHKPTKPTKPPTASAPKPGLLTLKMEARRLQLSQPVPRRHIPPPIRIRKVLQQHPDLPEVRRVPAMQLLLDLDQ